MNSPGDKLSLDKAAEERCDGLAEELLAGVKRRRVLPDYGAIEYLEEGSGDILLVCGDGSLLFTPKELGKTMALKAFKNGFRSQLEALAKRTHARQWELALTPQ